MDKICILSLNTNLVNNWEWLHVMYIPRASLKPIGIRIAKAQSSYVLFNYNSTIKSNSTNLLFNLMRKFYFANQLTIFIFSLYKWNKLNQCLRYLIKLAFLIFKKIFFYSMLFFLFNKFFGNIPSCYLKLKYF